MNQEPRRLVVTDKDFGRAYLREAWAARFLERIFSAVTVLFIRYSHGDVVMHYLTRLPGESRVRDPGVVRVTLASPLRGAASRR
jgi:hypothetical protein